MTQITTRKLKATLWATVHFIFSASLWGITRSLVFYAVALAAVRVLGGDAQMAEELNWLISVLVAGAVVFVLQFLYFLFIPPKLVGAGDNFIKSICIKIRDIQNARNEVKSREIEVKRNRVERLRKILSEISREISVIQEKVEKVPLNKYEKQYLCNLAGYQELREHYSRDEDAQYVVLEKYYFGTNPLFDDEYSNSQIIPQLVSEKDEISFLLSVPNLSTSIDELIKMRKMRAYISINDKLNPSKLSAGLSSIASTYEAEVQADKKIRDVEMELDNILTLMWRNKR